MNKSIFFPPKSNIADIQKLFRHDDYHTFLKSTAGANISVYVSRPLKGMTKYVVWAHGNANCIVHMIPYLQSIQNKLGIGFIIFDYQGYGCSDGSPSEDKCYNDIESVMSYALETLKISPTNLYLAGASLGTGIVVDYAYKHDWKTPMILVSPYKTIAKVVYDSSIVAPIDKFVSEKKIVSLDCPVRIFHGERDALISINHGKHLFSLLKNQSLAPIWIADADHNDIYWRINFDDIAQVLNHKIN